MDNTNQTGDQNQTPQDSAQSGDGGVIGEIMAMEPKDVSHLIPNNVADLQVTPTKIDAAKESKRIRWKCTGCGFVYEGYKKLQACPKSGHGPEFFEDIE